MRPLQKSGQDRWPQLHSHSHLHGCSPGGRAQLLEHRRLTLHPKDLTTLPESCEQDHYPRDPKDVSASCPGDTGKNCCTRIATVMLTPKCVLPPPQPPSAQHSKPARTPARTQHAVPEGLVRMTARMLPDPQQVGASASTAPPTEVPGGSDKQGPGT